MTQTSGGVKRPFLKNGKADSTWTIPTMPSSLNGNYGICLAANDRAEIVGYANIAAGSGSYRAFIWIPYSTFGLKNLNDLLSPSQQTQWTLIWATGISDGGRIVGYGTFNGATTAFLLYPN